MKVASSQLGSGVLSCPKQQDPNSLQRYNGSMRRSTDKKAEFFAPWIKTINSPEPVLLDLGCCNGYLTRKLSEIFPSINFTGIDANYKMVETAQESTPYDDWKNVSNLVNPMGSLLQMIRKFIPQKNDCQQYEIKPSFRVGDIVEFDYMPESIDGMALSAILHEIYSYGTDSFNIENFRKFMKIAREALAPNGIIMIRDPAKPPNPEEILNVSLEITNGLNPRTLENLLNTPLKQLSTNALLIRFLNEFEPAQRLNDFQGYFSDSNNHQLPSWLIHEFLFHRGFASETADWYSEIKEQYGVLTVEEMRNFAKENGWKAELIEATHDSTHRAAQLEGVTLSTINGNPINFEEKFPNNFRVVLRKLD